ncbi:alpha-1,4-glucan--maltose-1-phosphate maltosyltransferase [Peptidiphaga gingivicola]
MSTPKKQSAPRAHEVPAAPDSASAPAEAASSSAFAPAIGRIPIMEVTPQVEGGRLAAKGTEGESFPVQATVFREGHDKFAAQAELIDPSGQVVQTSPMVLVLPGLGRYEGWLTPGYPGSWSFRVRAWSDPYATWLHNAEVKLEAEVDVELVFLEAVALFRRAAEGAPEGSEARRVFEAAAAAAANDGASADDRFAAATSPEVRAAFEEAPLRDLETESAALPVNVDRIRALVGSWYEIFPRSIGAYKDGDGWHSGTLRTAAGDLDRIAGMGFDVLYLTPVHPIGSTNRKGRNNTLTAEPGDPGSPYAIGSHEGGHDAIHPDLGTFEDFDFLVGEAKKRGMEVALDVALQCSPDHPWLTEHPEWFTTRADGTIAYAENPPKKYQDIYPLNFDNDPEGIYREIKRILELWVEHGVTIFRVDNPHTKPVNFWERLLADFRESHPEVIFLAEAFTQPPMVRGLGAVGFHQSYTYFTWRNEKKEIEDYLWELARISDDRMRPAFWPTTHDILTPYMQRGGLAAFSIRAVLAATGAPTWGIYSGYELVENVARPGAEEQINNEKYEFKARDYTPGEDNGIPHLLGNLNRIRRDHPALQRLRGLVINPTSNEKILSFTRFARPEETPNGKFDAVIVVLNLDPYATRDALVYLDLTPFGVNPRWDAGPILRVTDELSGQTFLWNESPYVSLDPRGQCAHILSVKAI